MTAWLGNWGKQGLGYHRQKAVPVLYDGHLVGDPLRLDFLVEDAVVVEIKAVEQFHPVYSAQVLTYLRLTGISVGLLINFHKAILKDGIHRFLLDI